MAWIDRCSSRFRNARVVPLALGLCAALLCSPNDGFPQHLSPRPCPVIAAPDGIDTLVVQCGTVTVPQARDSAEALVPVELPVSVFRRPDTPIEATPVIYLAGGPGSSAIDEVATSFLASPTGQSLIGQRPIIAFDQRGFAGGDRAPWPELESALAPIGPGGVTLAELPGIVAASAAKLEAMGIQPRHFGTVDAALDVADVAHALGRTRTILFATSYGTRVALQVMRTNPALVESAILDGVVPFEVFEAYDLDLANTLRWRAVARVVDDCRVDPVCGREHAGITRDWARLARDTVPLLIPSKDPAAPPTRVSGTTLLVALGALLGHDAVVAAVPELMHDFASGDVGASDLFDVVVLAAAQLGGDSNRLPEHWLAYFAVACAESPMGVTQFGGLDLCDALRVPFEGAPLLMPIVGDVPVLSLAGQFDGITAPEWAALPGRSMPNAQAVEIPGVGHVTHLHAPSEECVGRLVIAFLDEPMARLDPTRLCEVQL